MYSICKSCHIVFLSSLWHVVLTYICFYIESLVLMYHRANKTKIIEHLREGWAKDRRAEWSIWMVYSKVEMPHHYINSGSEEPPNLAIRRSAVHKRVSSLWKLSDDVSSYFAEPFHNHSAPEVDNNLLCRKLSFHLNLLLPPILDCFYFFYSFLSWNTSKLFMDHYWLFLIHFSLPRLQPWELSFIVGVFYKWGWVLVLTLDALFLLCLQIGQFVNELVC